jgi:hypothetical protein
MDDADITTDRDEKQLPLLIAAARRVIPLHERPVLGCEPCSGISQDQARRICKDFASCLSDWEREQKIINKQNGK